MDDDDLKISMDDIKDMVSELFGEKVDKVGAVEAKKILKQEMLEFFETGPGETTVTKGILTEDEERLLKEFEAKKDTLSGTYEILSDPSKTEKPGLKITRNTASLADAPPVKLPAQIIAQIKEKENDIYRLPPMEGELKLRPPGPPVTEEERIRKREETLRKLEASRVQSAEYQAALNRRASEQPSALVTSHSDKVILLSMFEQTRKVFAQLLGKLIKRKLVETMMARTLEKAMASNHDVLKKANINHGGKDREDGSIEVPRIVENINSMPPDEEKRTKKFLGALRQIFDERLIATEIVTSIEVKDEIISAIMMQIDRIFDRNKYSQKLKDIFVEHIVPNTTIKSGE